MLQAVPSPSSTPAKSPIASIPEIVEEIRNGRIVVLVDDEDRENEGDLIFAADFVTPEKINFLAKYGRGLVCMPITAEHAARLRLAPMAQHNRTVHGTNFTVAIEAAEGVSTGISAADRAHTIRVATRPDAKPEDIVQPGHVFPLVAQPGGVLMRAGHTEACCDLARMAGLTPAAVLCEIMNDDGTMARLPDLVPFAQQHGLKIGTIADLIHYRAATESLITRVGARRVRTFAGEFELVAYRDTPSGAPHLALVKGPIDPQREVLVRVHEPTSVLDLIDTEVSVHSWPFGRALARIAQAEAGVLILLNCAEPVDRLFDKFGALADIDAGKSPAPRSAKMDLRTYGIGAQILRDLNVGTMKLLARPRKMPSMAGFGLHVTGYLEE
ncbi:3,4-dihydroxy-2-butanone-4-phosphate synthase [Betaproteobacteria bacterium PRO7]|jgi:3,4-dihydroxy 2-butanone 4-phosphate synthase/GTP cyclohydrolase II|nr:3,4-dihydroxy-2-butanone-4-phosphate synthase [Betaproteobacteria bacterium PRO7]